MNDEIIKWYSQIGQDKWVIDIFKQMTYGFFLDVGAGNGVDLSNTYTLEKFFKWEGICIEPHSKSFEELIKNRKCKFSNSFILKDNIDVDFIEYGDTGAHQDYFSSIKPYEDFTNISEISKNIKKLKTKSLYTVLNEMNSSTMIHYMSLDVEGCEYEILVDYFDKLKLNNSTHRIMSISVEHNFRNPDRENIKLLLEKNDYIYIKELFHDDLYIHSAFYFLI